MGTFSVDLWVGNIFTDSGATVSALVDTGAMESAIDSELDSTIDGPFDSVNLAGSGQPHYALIGGTFLRHFDMAYEGRTGSVIISNH